MKSGHRLAEGEPTVPMVTVSAARTGESRSSAATSDASAARARFVIIGMMILRVRERAGRHARQSGCDKAKTLPHCGRACQHARPAAALLVLARPDVAPCERVFPRGGREGPRRELVVAFAARANSDAGIFTRVQGHMLEFRLLAFARMRPVEIERKRVEELKLLVALEQTRLLDPGCGCRIAAKLGLQALLALELAVEHSLRQRAIVRRDLVDQHHAGEPIA